MLPGSSSWVGMQHIGGKWRTGSSSSVIQVRDPFTREVISEFQKATPSDIDDAYRAAAEVQQEWAHTPYHVKRSVMTRAADWIETHRSQLIDHLIQETGSSHFKSNFEIDIAIDLLRTVGGAVTSPVGEILPSPDPGKENFLYYEPVGVVGVISPFNTPLYLSLRAVAPALAFGNGVVIKADERAPVCGGSLLVRMFEDCGLPAGLVSVIVSDPAEMGDSFVEHAVPEVIVFTGSAGTGKRIAATAGGTLKKVVMELGGNGALLVLDDADLDYAAETAVFSRCVHAGQVCMSANRVVVHDSVHDDFVERYIAKMKTVPVGDPRDPQTIITPLITPDQASLLESQIAEAVEHGATLALAPQPRPDDSGLVTPVVLTDVTTDNPASRIEFFGPVGCVMRANDDMDAIRIANATEYGLSGAVHTRDLQRATRVARQLRAGMVHINGSTIADESAVPFGGVGLSGNGRLNGAANRDVFTRSIWVSVRHDQAAFPF